MKSPNYVRIKEALMFILWYASFSYAIFFFVMVLALLLSQTPQCGMYFETCVQTHPPNSTLKYLYFSCWYGLRIRYTRIGKLHNTYIPVTLYKESDII